MRSLSAYRRALVEVELAMLWWLRRDAVGRRLAYPLRQLVSQHPAADLTVLTWVAFAYGVQASGFRFAATCALNLGGVLLAKAAIGAKRPVDYDASLRQLANRGAGNFGFPSIESHMGVVVFFPLAPLPFALAACFLVGLSRLVAGSRFPHQVALSWATGALGILAAHRAVDAMPPWRKSWHHLAQNRPQVIFWLAVAFIAAALLAHAAEDNRSYFFSVPNADFQRVLRAAYATSARRPEVGTSFSRPPDSLAILSAQLSARRRHETTL